MCVYIPSNSLPSTILCLSFCMQWNCYCSCSLMKQAAPLLVLSGSSLNESPSSPLLVVFWIVTGVFTRLSKALASSWPFRSPGIRSAYCLESKLNMEKQHYIFMLPDTLRSAWALSRAETRLDKCTSCKLLSLFEGWRVATNCNIVWKVNEGKKQIVQRCY